MKLSKSQGTDRLELTPQLMTDLNDMVDDTDIEFEGAQALIVGTTD